jgi:hypothetical protein
MSSCIEFCTRLKTISLKNSVLPSHDELIARLQFTNDDQQRGQCLGTWDELQKRTQCDFCQLVVAAVSESAGPADQSEVSPDQPVNILIFPDEQSFRLSYPSLLGVRLAFVAQDDGQPSGPDTARLIGGSGIQISKIVSWLRVCNENHDECSLKTVEHELVRNKIDMSRH